MKIYIYGPSGIGKSTLAKKLSKHYNIRHYDIDSVLKDISDVNQRVDIIQDIFTKHPDGFVAEGLYKQDRINIILLQCDYIVLMREPLWKRNIKIIRRHIRLLLGLEKTHFEYNLTTLKKLLDFSALYEKDSREKEFLARLQNLHIADRLLYTNSYSRIINVCNNKVL